MNLGYKTALPKRLVTYYPQRYTDTSLQPIMPLFIAVSSALRKTHEFQVYECKPIIFWLRCNLVFIRFYVDDRKRNVCMGIRTPPQSTLLKRGITYQKILTDKPKKEKS